MSHQRKEKKIKLYKKRKLKDENFFDNQPELISVLAPEVVQEKRDYIYIYKIEVTLTLWNKIYWAYFIRLFYS